MVPTDHTMVDMSILLRAGATMQAVDKAGKPPEDTYWCICQQVLALLLEMLCFAMCNKGRNKVPYHTPYGAIRGRNKVPYRSPCHVIRGAIKYLVAPLVAPHVFPFVPCCCST